MARLLQMHSDGLGARTALGGLEKPLKSLAGNFRVSLPGVLDGCGRYSGTGRRLRVNRPVLGREQRHGWVGDVRHDLDDLQSEIMGAADGLLSLSIHSTRRPRVEANIMTHSPMPAVA